MLSFAVYDLDGQPLPSFDLRSAYAFGPDDVAVQAAISFERGIIRCERPNTDSAGIALQMEVEAPDVASARDGATAPTLGRLLLKTALLPDSTDPYLLTLELARERIMSVLNKLEDWDIELPPDDPVAQEIEEARAAFSEALCAPQPARVEAGRRQQIAARAERLARRALALAIDTGERLAIIQTDRQLPARLSGALYERTLRHAERVTAEPVGPGVIVVPGGGGVVVPGSPALGCTLNPQLFNEALQRVVQATCDFIRLPMRWMEMEPGEGKYVFAPTDRWIEWAVRVAKLPVAAGPLVDFRPRTTPDWLYIWENDYETLRELVFEHVQTIVTRYRRTVSRWTVVSGLHVSADIKLSLEQALDLTRICVLLVKKLQPNAIVQVEIAEPWGEYYGRNRRAIPPIAYAEAVRQIGLPVDAFGLRIQMGAPQRGQAARDLLAFASLLDRYAQLEKPLAITALGMPSGMIPEPQRPLIDDDDGTPAERVPDPGRWHGPCSEGLQAEWLTQMIAIALARPYVESVCWQELCDPPAQPAPAGMPALHPEMALGGLIASSGAPKAGALRLQQVRQMIRERRSLLALMGPRGNGVLLRSGAIA